MMRTSQTVYLGLMLTLGACAGEPSASAGAGYGIGVAFDPSPESNGLELLYGTQVAVNVLNATIPEGQPRFRVITAPSDVRDPIAMARTLRDDPAVLGVVGPRTSGEAFAAVGVYSDQEHDERDAVVTVSPSATSPGLEGIDPWLFRLSPNDNANAATVARYLLDSTTNRRVVVVFETSPFGRDFARVFIDAFVAGGGTILTRAPYLRSSTNPTEWAVYAKLLKRINPDAIVMPGYSVDGLALLRQLKQSGAMFPVYGGDDMDGLEEDASEFPNVYYISHFSVSASQTQSDKARQFIESYERAYRIMPAQGAALAYDAALLLGQAIQQVGPDRAKVRAYIEGVGLTTPTLNGVTGPIAFDRAHNVQKSAIVKQVGQ